MEKISLSLKLDVEFVDTIDLLAEQETRSRANMTEILLKEAISARANRVQ